MRAKYLLISVVVLSVAGILTVPSYAEIDPETIVAFWNFDDGAGGTAEDGSGNDLHGGLVGNPEWVDGKVNKALAI